MPSSLSLPPPVPRCSRRVCYHSLQCKRPSLRIHWGLSSMAARRPVASPFEYIRPHRRPIAVVPFFATHLTRTSKCLAHTAVPSPRMTAPVSSPGNVEFPIVEAYGSTGVYGPTLMETRPLCRDSEGHLVITWG